MTFYGWWIGLLLVIGVILAAVGLGPGFFIGVIIGAIIGVTILDVPLFKEDE